MKKQLSTLGLLWISLTSMIGSGWLFGSLYSAHYAGPAAILAWPIAGFLLLFVALAYAEVATLFPTPGILSRLPLYTHGRLVSVITSGLAWLSLAAIPAIETQGLIQYASNYLPHLVAPFGTHYETTPFGYFVVVLILMSFVLINYFGIRLFSRVNAIFTIWKLFVPTLTVICLLSLNYHSPNFSQYSGWMPYGWHGVMEAISGGGVFFSLLGFQQVVIMMGEIDNPGKYVPLVLISSLIMTTILYTALQWSFISSLRPQDLLQGWAHISFPGDAGPFAALALLAGLIWLSILLYVDAFVSPYATGLVYSTTSAHMLAGMGSTADAPRSFARVNKYQVPWVSLLINFLLAAGFFFLLNGWQAMTAFAVAAMLISYGMGPICLICLRKQLPNQARPFRLRCGGLIAFIGFYVCTAGIYWSGLHCIIKLTVLTALGLILYACYCLKEKPHQYYDSKNALWLLCYLAGLVIFSYLGNYGGKHLMPGYWDLLFLLGFSFLIFMLAIISRKPNIDIGSDTAAQALEACDLFPLQTLSAED